MRLSLAAPRARRAGRQAAGAGAAYVALALVYFGLPIAAHPGRVAVGSDNDPKLFIWMFAWWPHAIAHGLNPIYTHAIWEPSGYNLAWATSVPALALAFSPLTALAGPVAAYNTAAVLMPALAAWTAYLLCRYLTSSFWPALLGGYLFGFTSYLLGHEEGHLNLAAVCLLPLVALALLRGLRGELGRRGLAIRLGLLLAAQILLSTEVFATLTIALLVGFGAALLLVPAVRRPARTLAAPVAAAYAGAAALTSPFLYYALSDVPSGGFTTPGIFVADAVNLVVPTRTLALGGDSSARLAARFPGNELEQTAYLGVPLLLLLCVFFVGRWREPGARFLLGSFTVAVVLAFGNGLHVDGHRVAAMPWSLVSGLPILDNIYPERFTLYATLAAAVAAALWCASPRAPGWFRLALPALVIAAFVPNLGRHLWDEKLTIPHFFATGTYARCLAPGENVLVLPYGYAGSSVLWQALGGFRFSMPGGEVGDQQPHPFRVSVVDTLRFDGVPPGGGADVLAFAQEKNVTTILVDPGDPVPWARLLTAAGRPQHVGGLLVYRLGAARRRPGCSG